MRGRRQSDGAAPYLRSLRHQNLVRSLNRLAHLQWNEAPGHTTAWQLQRTRCQEGPCTPRAPAALDTASRCSGAGPYDSGLKHRKGRGQGVWGGITGLPQPKGPPEGGLKEGG